MSDPENSAELRIPKRQKNTRHNQHRIIRKPKRLAAMTLAAVLSVGAAADYLGLIDLPGFPDFSANPGQIPGKTVLEDIDIVKFRASSTDALGEATVKVDRVTQVMIDKPEKGDKKSNPHETRIYDEGEYTAQWVVSGVWKPELQPNGDLVVTLPESQGKRIVTEKDPKYNDDASEIATMQWIGSLGGASTEDDIAYDNARTKLTDWANDPEQSGTFHRAVSCVALAGAAGKAEAFSLSTPVNIVKFTPAREPVAAPEEGLPTISFQIPNPTEKGSMLNMESCLETLDDMGFDPKTMSTDNQSAVGLATYHIKKLELPEHIQE